MISSFFRLFVLLFAVGGCVQAQTFTDVAKEMGIQSHSSNIWKMGGGVAFFDVNKDGFEDVYISGGVFADSIYLNMGGDSFEPLNTPTLWNLTAELFTNGVAIGDIDNDGDEDLFVLTGGLGFPQVNLLMENNGDNTFTDITLNSTFQLDSSMSMGATFGDFNLDGFIDLYVGNYYKDGDPSVDENGEIDGFPYEGFSNRLYYNSGDNTFSDVTLDYQLGDKGLALAVAATDFDQDNDLDIFLANDFGEWNYANALYENQYPADEWLDVAEESNTDIRIFAMGIAIGDYDEDGDFDYYVTNLGRNVLFRNEGGGVFTDVSTFAGVENTFSGSEFSTGWGTAFIDLNNDSYLDLYVSNGEIPAAEFIATNLIDSNKVFINNADGTFRDHSLESNAFYAGRSRGMAYGDFDRDGDLDVLTGNIYDNVFGLDQNCSLFRNDSPGDMNWLQISLEGVFSNRNAYGARVIVEAAGRTFIREIDGGSSHASRSANFAHFGLADIEQIDNVRVVWPGGGEQFIGSLAINERHHILEDINSGIDENSQLENSEIAIELVPNLVNDHAELQLKSRMLESSQSKSVQLTLVEISGRVLAVGEIDLGSQNAISVDHLMNSLSAGEYFIQLRSKSWIKQIPFVKE